MITTMPALSPRSNDVELVRSYIHENALDPVPLRDREPVAARKGRARLVMESYSWGVVCFARSPEGSGISWVEHHGRPELPAWANDLRLAAERPENREPVDEVEAERLRALRVTGLPPSGTQDSSSVPRATSGPAGTSSQQPGGQAKQRKAPRVPKGKQREMTPRARESIAIVTRLAQETAARAKRRLLLPPGQNGSEWARSALRPGDLILRDSFKGSGYLVLLVRIKGNANKAVARLFPLTGISEPGCSVQIATPDSGVLLAELPDALELKEWNDHGKVHAVVKRVTSAFTAIVADKLANLINRERIYGYVL